MIKYKNTGSEFELPKIDKIEEIKLGKQYRQSCASIERFSFIQKQILSSSAKRVVIDVMETTYIADGLLLLLAVLPDFSAIYGKSIVIRYNLQNSRMVKALSNSGVLDYYKKDGKTRAGTDSIPFMRTDDVGKYADLVKRIMELAPVQFNEKSYTTMFSKLYEIFINAGTHGKNELGTYTYGTLRRNEFIFTIYDAGVGIKENVNHFLQKNYSAQEAMNWALKSGNSTLITDYPRGAGFSLLETFAYKNSGKITLCSDNIICIMEKGNRTFRCMKTNIRGTLFIMNIKADREYIYDMNKEMSFNE